MVKKCRILIHNSAVTVVDFDGTHIQFPSIETQNKEIYVEDIDGRYSVVSEEEYKKFMRPKVDKKSKKSKVDEADLVEDVVVSEVEQNDLDETSDCPYCS